MNRIIFIIFLIADLLFTVNTKLFSQILDPDKYLQDSKYNRILFESGSCPIICMDLNTDRILWEYFTNNSYPRFFNNEDSLLYVVSNDKNLHILDCNSGKKIWGMELPVKITSGTLPNYPLLYFNGFDSTIYAFDLITKKTTWSFKTNAITFNKSLLYENQFFDFGDSMIYCFNAVEGNLNWKYKTNGKINSRPDIFEDKVFFGCKDGNLYCLNRKNGSLINKIKISKDQPAFPTIFDDKLIYSKMPGLINVENASTGELLWAYEQNNLIGYTITPDDSSLFFVADTILYCHNIQNGEKRYEILLNKKLKPFSKPLIKKNNLYMKIVDGSLLKINLENKEQKIIYKVDTNDRNKSYKEPEIDLELLGKNVHYPAIFRKMELIGKVIVKVLVGANGEKKKYLIEYTDSELIIETAISAIEKTPIKPAEECGEPVTSWITIPINFKLK